jgi:glyoxylase-like metal-dependent hydrolase (beta-lactamase superfamily II)
MQQLTPQVYGILKWFKFMNCYLVVQGDTLTAVDFGTGALFTDAIIAGVQALGKSLDQLRYAFVTHCHYDHIGGLAALQKRVPHLQTYAHRLDAPVIRGEQPYTFANPAELDWLNARVLAGIDTVNRTPARVDVELEDGAALDFIAPQAQAIHLPGHCFGQIGLWLPTERTLIGGDVMGNYAIRLGLPLRSSSSNWAEVKNSVRKVAALNVATLCLGHGAPVIGNAAAKIQALVARN